MHKIQFIIISLSFPGVYLNVFKNLAARSGRERLTRAGFDSGLRTSFFFLVETLSITGQKHLKCSKNGNGRLRKRNP